MFSLFQDNFILVEATSSRFCKVLRHNSYFFGAAISSQELLFSPFSEPSLFRRSYFYRTAYFRSENSIEQPLLENRRFFTVVTVRNSVFFGRTVYDKDILKRATFSKQVLLHSINLFRKAILWKKLIFQKINFRITYFFWRAVFLEQLLFQKTLPSIAATFPEELLFYNILFQKSYYFTATVPFRSHTFYLFVSN